jgi:3-oxoacyl-[acyl-carrier-protein] synthase-3
MMTLSKTHFMVKTETSLNHLLNEIIKKFEDITGISERRYVSEEWTASDLGYIAAKKAIEDANMDPETLDQIIVAHNYGDVALITLSKQMLYLL